MPFPFWLGNGEAGGAGATVARQLVTAYMQIEDEMKLIKKDSTNISVEIYIIDSTDGTPETGVLWNTSGIDLNYRRDGAVVVSITEQAVSGTPLLTDPHVDGGFLEIANGRYRLDVPDAAFATGVDQVTIGGTVTGMIVMPVTIQLVDFDPTNAGSLGLSVFTGMTSLPEWLGAMAGSQTANTTAITEIRATGAGSGTYDATTMALEACFDDALTAADVATGVWTDTTVGDFTAPNSIGLSVMNGVALGTGLTVNDITTKTGYSLVSTGLDLVTAWTTNITGNLSGSVGSVTGAVGSVTGAVGSVTGAVGSVAGNVDGNVSGTVTLADGAHGGASAAITLNSYSDFTGAGMGLNPLSSGTAQSGTASTIVLAAAATFADNELNGNVINIYGGTGAGQSRVILSNTLADDTCNISPNWATNPDNTSQYEIVQGSTNITAVSNVAEDLPTATAIAALNNVAATDIVSGGAITTAGGAVSTVTTVGTTTTNTDMRGTDSAALATALATAQTDLDTITGTDGVTLATAQALYAPNTVVPDAAGTAAGLHTTTDALVAALNDISVADILDAANGVETGMTLREAMRIILSSSAGKLSGAATTAIAIRDVNDAKDRISATVDADGNRSAVTLDVT